MKSRYAVLFRIGLVGLFFGAILTVILYFTMTAAHAGEPQGGGSTGLERQPVYEGLAELGNLTSPEEIIDQDGNKQLEDRPQTDERYVMGNQITYKSVLDTVADKLGVSLDQTSDADVLKFMSDWNALSYEARIKYGMWGENTPEGKVQTLLNKGVKFEEAKHQVDPNKTYWK